MNGIGPFSYGLLSFLFCLSHALDVPDAVEQKMRLTPCLGKAFCERNLDLKLEGLADGCACFANRIRVPFKSHLT